jgi:hypothetical protein
MAGGGWRSSGDGVTISGDGGGGSNGEELEGEKWGELG